MPNKDRLIEDIDWLSERLSNRVWFTSTVTIATCIALLLEGAASENQAFLAAKDLALPIVLAIIAGVCDFVQYFCGYLNSKRLLDEMEISGNETIQYKTSGFLYRVRTLAFHLKLLFSTIGMVWLGCLLLRALLI